MVDVIATGPAAGTVAPRPSALDLFRVRSFTPIWLSGLIWHLSRWGVSFLGAYLVNDLTGSPRLVQLTGSLLYAPLLVGGVVGGAVSDRFDRLKTVRLQLLVIVPLSVAMGVLVRSGRIQVWMVYGFMFMVGIGWVTDMTSRRAMVFDIVGRERVGNAMALESLSMASGAVVGALVGGAAVQAIGVGSAYFVVAGLVTLSFVVLLPARAPAVEPRVPAAGAGPGGPGGSGAVAPARPVRDLVDGIRILRKDQGVISILGVTVVANFFLFAYSPLVPVVAKHLGARPFVAGLLAAAQGMGMMAGSILVARWQPARRGLVYVCGVLFGFLMMFGFSLATVYVVAFVSLVATGIGSGFFGSTQSALVMAEAPEHLRGRALGLLSMAIGALPVGMYVLGEVAQHLGVRTALVVHMSVGLACLVLWVGTHPSVRRITA